MNGDQTPRSRPPGRLPHRVRLQRSKGWRMPAGAIKVDRATVFGNPFVAGQENGLGWGLVRDNEHAVWLFRQWLATPARSIVFEADKHRAILERLHTLAGHDLACWCLDGWPCHADVLIELSNRVDVVQVSGLLLGGWTAAPSPVEMAVVLGQFGRITGMSSQEISNLAATADELVTMLRHRAEQSNGEGQ